MRVANFVVVAFVAPRSGDYLDDLNPATEEVMARIPDSDGRDVGDAVEAARGAFPSWSRTPAGERSRLLLRVADLIETTPWPRRSARRSGTRGRSASAARASSSSAPCTTTYLRVPFGGMRESGVGREGGFESLAFFTEAKNVCVKL